MILLLEDSDDDAYLIEECLKNSGQIPKGIKRVSTLKDALEQLYEEEFTIAICDLNLPDARGAEIITKLAQSHPSVAIIAVSGLEPDIEVMLTAGAQEALSKDRLNENIGAVCKRARLRKQADSTVRARLTHDSLTGLHNRVFFQEHCERLLARYKRNSVTFSILYLDIDGFKTVNDLYGQLAGDDILREVAHRIKAAVRIEDCVARIGGDEFGIGVEGFPQYTAQRILKAFEDPFLYNGQSVTLGVSIGTCNSTVGDTIQNMLRAADEAMMLAKGAGGRRSYSGNSLTLGNYDSEVVHALEREELYLVYQPIVDSSKGVVDREALLRWSRPVREHSSPADFIPVLEVTNRIVEVGAWVLGQALARWPDSPVSVNVSTIQLEYDFYSVVKSLLGERDPSTLTLEITESSLLLDSTKQELVRLKGLGVRIALDDFGTGYSSLSALLAAHIDEIKIDVSFTRKLPDVRVESVIEMLVKGSKKLGYMVVAEGVETDAQAEILDRLGVIYHQGYLYSRPIK